MQISFLIRIDKEKQTRWKRAQSFIGSAMDQGHTIRQFFFEAQGVTSAIAEESMPRWIELSSASGAPLVLCSQAVEKYRIAVPDPFVVGGLGTLIEASVLADRTMSFV